MKIEITRIKQIEWIKTITRPMFLYGQVPQTEGERDYLQRKIGVGFRNKILFPAEGGHIQFFGKENWNNFAFAINEKLKKEKDTYKKYISETTEECEELIQYLLPISLDNLSLKSNSELLEYFNNFEIYRAKLAYALYPPLIMEKALENELKDELKKTLQEEKKGNLFDEYLNIIGTKSSEVNESDQEEIELLKLAREIQDKGHLTKELDIKLEKHAEKYGWLPYYGYGLPIGNKEYFLHQMDEINNPKERLDDKEKKILAQNKSIRRIKDEFTKYPHLEELIEITQIFLHLRQYRTEVLRKAYYYPRNLLMEISRRMEIQFDNSFFLLPAEINDFLAKGETPSITVLEERKNNYALILVDGVIEVISKKDELENLREILFVNEVKQKSTLQGMGIYKGVVKGTVKIVSDIRESSKINKGDILVTTMTTPEMHQAIDRATGIITDEGGLTCHAAIISRELHIPCVIGTGNATQILHDGEMVILDSEKGIIEVFI